MKNSRGEAIFYYYGAKRQVVRRYPKPAFSTIIEPFAGSGAYAIHHILSGAADKAILVEKDSRVVALRNRVLAFSDSDIANLCPPDVGSWTEDLLFMCCAASNATARCRGFSMTQRALDVFSGLRRNMLRVLPIVRGRITIIEGDYRDSPDVEATWFLDPPYSVRDGEVKTKTVFPRGMGYAKNCSSNTIDYPSLALWAKQRKGQVIVCEQEGAEWLPFVPLAKNQNSQGVSSIEMIWSGPNGYEEGGI